MSDLKVSLKFIGYEKKDDHVDYKIIVKDSNNDTWQFLARYSSLRQIYRELREIFSADKLPDFPPKKYFGASSDTFITQRQKALENFCNNLLKKYRYEELTPLKNYIDENKTRLTPPKNDDEPDKKSQPQPRPQPGPRPHEDQPVSPMKKNLEKIVGNLKNEFFDLNDTFNPPDEDEVRKKKGMYNFKLEVALPKNAYELPSGTEANLILIQDKTLPSTDSGISSLLLETLNNIREGIQKINLLNEQPIIVILD